MEKIVRILLSKKIDDVFYNIDLIKIWGVQLWTGNTLLKSLLKKPLNSFWLEELWKDMQLAFKT